MADKQDARKHFPNIDNKLKAGPVKTTFAREKERADNKRRREAEEEKAALAEFEEHMGVVPDDPQPSRRPDRLSSLSQLPPPPKAPRLGNRLWGPLNQDFHGNLNPDAQTHPPTSPRASPDLLQSANVDVDTVESTDSLPPRPTLLVRNLPPDFDQGAVLSTVFGAALRLDRVVMMHVDRPHNTRPFRAAVAICPAGTPVKALDDFCRKHNGKYLARGYYLDVSKHEDESQVDFRRPLYFESGQPLAPRPFGAIPVSSCPNIIQAALGVPFAPDGLPVANAAPDHPSFESRHEIHQPVRRIQSQISTVVIPRAPLALWRVKLINWTVENIVRHGPMFEALLMNDIEVQLDKKWDFLWDSTSADGAWFYWRLYETATGYDQRKVPLKSEHPPRFHLPYSGRNMPYWVEPFEVNKYYGALTPQELLKHHEFQLGDEDLSDEDEDLEARRRHRAARPQRISYSDSHRIAFDQPQYLGTVQRAKLIWLLKDVPESRGKLLNGDVMAVTAFAIDHSGAHEEVVDLLIANIIRPFSTRTATEVARAAAGGSAGAAVTSNGADNGSAVGATSLLADTATVAMNGAAHKHPASGHQIDSSSEKLVALSLITDVLSACATAGVRDSWFYRQGFTDKLLSARIFERLGVLHRDEDWGFMRKGNFERSVMAVIDQWVRHGFFDEAKTREMCAQFVGPGRDPDERR